MSTLRTITSSLVFVGLSAGIASAAVAPVQDSGRIAAASITLNSVSVGAVDAASQGRASNVQASNETVGSKDANINAHGRGVTLVQAYVVESMKMATAKRYSLDLSGRNPVPQVDAKAITTGGADVGSAGRVNAIKSAATIGSGMPNVAKPSRG